ncbi:hypothetical protein Hdeb2414_s0088g00786131 [Helianthus debilis subsp. tardiflorus]
MIKGLVKSGRCKIGVVLRRFLSVSKAWRVVEFQQNTSFRNRSVNGPAMDA